MWLAVVLVASVGLSSTLGLPTSGEALEGVVDTKTLKNPREPAECKVNCGKENVITNQKSSKENKSVISSASDIKNTNTNTTSTDKLLTQAPLGSTSTNKPVAQQPLGTDKPSVVQSPNNYQREEFLNSVLDSKNPTLTTSSNSSINQNSSLPSTEASKQGTDGIKPTPTGCTCVPYYLCKDPCTEENESCRLTTCADSLNVCCLNVTDSVELTTTPDDIKPTPTGCTCVPYYLCKDPCTEENESCRSFTCADPLNLCCFNVTDSVELTTKSTNGAPSIEELIDDIFPPSNKVTPSPPTRSCGRSVVMNSRLQTGDPETIAGGQAEYGEFPWMVWVGNSSLSTLCGGSLIHPEVVLTGAHCVNGKEDIVIRAGEWDTQTKAEEFPHQELRVKEIVVHDKFNKGSLANDPALLILDEPVNLTEYVGLVCLPEAEEDFNGQQCLTSGWGRPLNSEEDQSSILKRVVDLPIVPRDECQEALRKTKLGERFRLHETFTCAGGTPGRDTCKGDGGSPLVCPSRLDPLVHVQAGIVAWGISCGTDTPGVYVNVAHFVPWIKDQLKARSLS